MIQACNSKKSMRLASKQALVQLRVEQMAAGFGQPVQRCCMPGEVYFGMHGCACSVMRGGCMHCAYATLVGFDCQHWLAVSRGAACTTAVLVQRATRIPRVDA